MRKINKIEPTVYNLISAGEVIERPASVVKECVENSLDGGATEISIYISNDAKNIRIVDNGVGMSNEDAQIAFLPHCSSKLKTADDLNEIQTLGFRGEALASVSAVAMVTMNTFDRETRQATKIEIRGGEITAVEDGSVACGTDISIENLFFNTPVREKFLKTPRSEESEISNLITRLILSNPRTSFKYYLNNEPKIIFNGNGLEKAIYTIYGRQAVESSIKILGTLYDIMVDGFIGKPDFTKGNRTYQTLILNGRYILNETVSAAILKAYQPFVMKRSYPFYVLNITVPTNMVDVNVHPTKREVRFSDPQAVFKTVYHTVSSALSGETQNIVDRKLFSSATKPNLPETKIDGAKGINEQIKLNTKYVELIKQNQNTKKVDLEKGFDSENNVSNNNVKQDAGLFINPNIPLDVNSERYKRLYNIVEDGATPLTTAFPPHHDLPYYDVSVKAKIFDAYTAKPEKPLKPVVNEDGTYILETTKKYKKEGNANGFYLFDSESTVDEYPDYEKVRVIGVFNKTYIIAEYEDTLYFIDQHAAHERILFDEYTLAYHNEQILVQDLVVPYLFEINMIEEEFLRKHISNLYALGFRIDNFGHNTFRINSVPVALSDINFDKFLKDLFSDVERIMEITSVELLREQIMQKACKHAVKAGDQLSEYEIKCIFKMLEKTKTLTCPHGRPILVSYKKSDIEKWFKRIL